MHPEVYEAFTKLFERHPVADGTLLEIGAGTDTAKTLLTWFASQDRFECIGIDLRVKTRVTAGLPYRLMEMNANDLGAFPDDTFSAVISNAVLEHDRSFWLTLSEVRRVLRPDGLFFVGVPGYRTRHSTLQRLAMRPNRTSRLSRVTGLVTMSERFRLSPLAGTSTLWYHAAPRDYYRFSEDAVRDVFLEGMVVEDLQCVLTPPRILAVGRRTAAIR